VADTTPAAARDSLAGMVFEGFVADADLPNYAARHRLLSAVLVEGRTNRTRVFVPPAATPPDGFVPSPATLDDAYLVLMRVAAHEIPAALARSAPAAREPGR
jgi:hypothetical protein